MISTILMNVCVVAVQYNIKTIYNFVANICVLVQLKIIPCTGT